jgi:nucleoid DNA-binding protein
MMQQPQPKPDMAILQATHKSEMEKTQAESARKVGEMQETILEMTGDLERKDTKIAQLEAEKKLQTDAANVKMASREHQLRTTFQGTLKQQKDAADQKVKASEQKADAAGQTAQAAQQETKQVQNEGAMQALVDEIRQAIDGIRQEMTTKAQADDVVSKKEQAMQDRFEKQQAAFLDAMGKVALAMTAKRTSRLEIDPKTGEKRAVSEVLQ